MTHPFAKQLFFGYPDNSPTSIGRRFVLFGECSRSVISRLELEWPSRTPRVEPLPHSRSVQVLCFMDYLGKE